MRNCWRCSTYEIINLTNDALFSFFFAWSFNICMLHYCFCATLFFLFLHVNTAFIIDMTTTSVPCRWKYDVFVSFRGEDIRKSFMDHLFKEFRQKGIHAFRDDKELPKGEKISPELYKAIEESRFLIVIFSKNYASSSWCLRELTKILECKQMGEHKHEVRIIFYDVKPNVVRKQTGSYAEAFVKHEFSNRAEVAKWKEALGMASNLSGWGLEDKANGYESKFIDSISKEILNKLFHGPLHICENLVGVDACVNEMNLSRFIGSDKVHMIGICGISGMGKTTLAKAIYNLMCTWFEECCFCEDVQRVAKQKGLTQVQMQLIDDLMKTRAIKISNVSQGIMIIKQRMASKPILLVLDDVDHREQLEALAGSPDWFAPGSLIAFTSEDRQLLRSYKVEKIYDMPFLSDHEAFELFSLCAFGKKHPVEDFKDLAYQVVICLKGHPLALKVLGHSLYDKPMRVWKSELDKLHTYPNAEVQQKLRPSFDGLDFDQKRIFLDIACSFIGEKKDFAASVLASSDCFAEANIEVLVNKSLITISGDDIVLQMHELIRSMAREIVREESNCPGDRSRLWILSEVCNVLSENKATEAVEVLDLLLEDSNQKVHIDMKAFTHMRNLRILKICDHELVSVWKPFELKRRKDSKVNYSGRLEFLSNKLRLLYWHGCPFKFFPSDFYPEHIVSIDLSYGHIKEIWTSPKCFGRLKVMKLKHCRNLTRTPDFTKITNLEVLNLEGCVKLAKVHSSIGMLKRLVVLNMEDCKRFKSFPCKVEWDTLEVMNLSGCSKVDKLPDFFDTIQTLKEFCVDGTAIMKLPSFVYSQCNLQVLRIGPHGRIQSRRWTPISHSSCLPSKMQHSRSLVIPSLVGLCFLRELQLGNCNISEVPNSIGGLSCLEYLDLHGNNFTNLPGCLSQLSRLETLELSGCKKLEVLPELPPTILTLFASNCTSLQELQGRIKDDQSYAYFNITGCPKLLMNLTIDHSRMSMPQPQPMNSSLNAHGSRNQFTSLLQYMNIPTTTRGIFFAHKRSFVSNHVDMIFHGNRIPQWFTNQSIGNHVMVELPPYWCYNKFKGYGTCTVLSPKKYSSVEPKYFVKNFDGTSLQVDYGPFPYINESDIIWFHFSTECSGWRKAQNFVTFSFQDDNDAEVKECGVRLVCDEDIQEDVCINQYLQIATQGGGVIGAMLDSKSMKLHW